MTTWPEIYREHAAGLRAFLRHRLRSTEAAEDLCNETFVKAIEAEGSIRDHSKIRSFLYRIAHNLSLNQLRRPDTVRTESELVGGIDWEAETNPEQACPSSVVEQRELLERLEHLLSSLPEDQQRAFRWAVLEGHDYAEIREMTGWSSEKVKISVFRARKALVKGLEEYRHPELSSKEGAA